MTGHVSAQSAPATERASDVCIVVEGCYPYIAGGVSAWIDWLMRSQPETSFSVVALWPGPVTAPAKYKSPPNMTALHHLYLQQFGARPEPRGGEVKGFENFSAALNDLMIVGGREPLAAAMTELQALKSKFPIADIFNAPAGWYLARDMYKREMPGSSFLHYFWAWRALLGGLLSVLEFPLPKAGVYHTISTGYAGLLAARASIETGRPALLTEHGIYTNERRIELLMADWVTDTLDKGFSAGDERMDLRDLWIRVFEAYARSCYETAREVITLYRDNQRPQALLGAAPEKQRVIANGIDVARFSRVQSPAPDARPTVALIGRVVPIKDVKTFIEAARLLKQQVPELRAFVLGPTDEDPAYFRECQDLVDEYQLGETVIFTGAVNVIDYLGEIHVMALTSLSESQPLVILEAGAAGIPFVATDVGSCREIIEGPGTESPHLGAGGVIAPLGAPDEFADAVARLLLDAPWRNAAGAALKMRTEKYYTSKRASESYRDLYARYAQV